MAGLLARLWTQVKSTWTMRLLGSFDEMAAALSGDGSTRSPAAARVNWKTALTNSVALSCIRVLSEGVAQVPCRLMRASPDGRKREEAREHPLFAVLYRRPNPWQTSFEYRETVMLHAVFTGNHYSFINRVLGHVRELLPLDPSRVRVKQEEGTYRMRYFVRGTSGAEQEFPAESIWHVRGPSWDGLLGLDIVKLARETLGLAFAIEEQQSKFYEEGATPTSSLSVKETLTEEQYKKLRKWIQDEAVGSKRPVIVDKGAEWKQLSTSGVDAQTREQRLFQIEETCRFFRVMPIMVGYSDKAQTYASAEQMFLAHVTYSLSPWYERLEQSADVNLLTEEELASGLYVKFSAEALLRGSAADTVAFLTGLVNGGLMYPNEARARLDLDADPDPKSDKLREPVTAASSPKDGEKKPGEEKKPGTEPPNNNLPGE